MPSATTTGRLSPAQRPRITTSMTDTRQTRGAGPKEGLGDLVDLIKDYARQETVDPLKGAGRWVGFGLLGSVLVMIGGIALTLALLRALQEETGSALTGNLSWAPYALTLLALSVVIGLLALRINKKTL